MGQVVKLKDRKTVMRASDSYLFREKHPLIDRLRTAMQNEGVTYETIHQKTGVSVSTLSHWFDGTTKRPQATTLNQVAMYFGLELTWVATKHGPSWLRWRKDKDTTWADWYNEGTEK